MDARAAQEPVRPNRTKRLTLGSEYCSPCAKGCSKIPKSRVNRNNRSPVTVNLVALPDQGHFLDFLELQSNFLRRKSRIENIVQKKGVEIWKFSLKENF